MSSVQTKGNILIVDVGSGSVGCALIESSGSGKTKIVETIRKDIPFTTESSFDHFSFAMLESLGGVIAEMKKRHKIKLDGVHCFLSSPWYVSDTRKVSLASKKNFIVNRKEIDALIKKEVDTFTESAGAQYERFIGEPAELVEAKNIQVKLNGYQTDDPYGKKATQFEALLFVSLSTKTLISSLKNRINVHYAGEVHFHTFTLSAFSCIRSIFSDKHNFLFLDITGETTNILFCRDNIIADIISVPVGRQTLIRRIASKLMTTPQEAHSQFMLLSQGKLDTTAAGRVQKTLDRFGKDWSDVVIRAISTVTKDTVPPNTLFTTAGPVVSDWFGQTFSQDYMDAYSFTEEALTIFALRSDILDKWVMHATDVPRDPFLIIETVFIGKILG